MDPPVGLCASCCHSRVLRSARGSEFRLCERSRADASFRRYPRLPVLDCAGHEPAAPDAGDRPEPFDR